MPYKDENKRREAHRKYMREVWYPKNKKKHQQYVKEQKEKLEAWLEEYKSSLSCEECGESHIATLDFHHIDPTEKESGVTASIRRWGNKERTIKEIKKCTVLCSNCHRILHWQLRNLLQ